MKQKKKSTKANFSRNFKLSAVNITQTFELSAQICDLN